MVDQVKRSEEIFLARTIFGLLFLSFHSFFVLFFFLTVSALQQNLQLYLQDLLTFELSMNILLYTTVASSRLILFVQIIAAI